MKRITIPEVEAAYETTGIKPLCRRYSFVEGNAVLTCGCPQTAMYYAAIGMRSDITTNDKLIADEVRDWANARYGSDYASQFRTFFDNPDSKPDWPLDEREQQGRDDGRAVRAALSNVGVLVLRDDRYELIPAP